MTDLDLDLISLLKDNQYGDPLLYFLKINVNNDPRITLILKFDNRYIRYC